MDREKQQRERLKDVHQTDLTESRVNEDFLDWLKNKGPSWLLVILIAICAFLAMHRFRTHKVQKQAEAWAALSQAQLPSSFEDVAEEYGSVGQIDTVAYLAAAEQLMSSVQLNKPVGQSSAVQQLVGEEDGDAPDEPAVLTDDERRRYLDRAEQNYDRIIDQDTQAFDLTLYVVNAMFGKAAIAEARGDVDAARQWYTKGAERAEAFYPGLARQGRMRIENIERYTSSRPFLPEAELPSRRSTQLNKRILPIDEELKSLIMPPDETGP